MLLFDALSRSRAEDPVSASLAKSFACGAVFDGTVASTLPLIGEPARPPEKLMAISSVASGPARRRFLSIAGHISLFT